MSQQDTNKANSDHRIQDRDMKEVDLEGTKIEVREKKGILRLAIPHVTPGVAWLVLFLNVFLPGTGTLILALISLCGVKTDLEKQNRCLAFLVNLGTAILQTVTAVIIVGWIWSVYWGMHAVTEANARSDEAKNKRRLEKSKEEGEKERLNDGEESNTGQVEENQQTDGTQK